MSPSTKSGFNGTETKCQAKETSVAGNYLVLAVDCLVCLCIQVGTRQK